MYMIISILGWKRKKLPEYLEKAEKLCNELAKNGCTIYTGAGTGIMSSANKGAFYVDKKLSKGITLDILGDERKDDPYILEENIEIAKKFHERKRKLMQNTDVNIFFPGGMGTLDEFTDLVNLYKTGEVQDKKPIYLFGEKYWNSLIEWFRFNNIKFPSYLIKMVTDDIDDILIDLGFKENPKENKSIVKYEKILLNPENEYTVKNKVNEKKDENVEEIINKIFSDVFSDLLSNKKLNEPLLESDNFNNNEDGNEDGENNEDENEDNKNNEYELMDIDIDTDTNSSSDNDL